jgi:type IV secretion system protein TrbL
MSDTGVIDRFFDTFNRYIDSGFGLLGGEVAFLSTTLVAIDVTLAALFWAWASGEDVIARLIRKTLYVGFFAFLIGNFQALSAIILSSFAGLGLKASGSGLAAGDLLRPGKVAARGISAIKPLLESAAQLGGFPALFENLIQVIVLLFSALLILVAFFVMAVQIFVVLIEFKLTTLAGFVLVPFGLFGRTAFLAERVLGNVIASGIKVMVLAVIVGIGSSLFDAFTATAAGDQPTLEAVLALTLAAITLLGLSIFGPGIATGLVSGAPQLGAGAAVGTGMMIGGMAMAGAAAAQMVSGAGAGLAGAAAGAGGGARPPPGGGAAGALPPPLGPTPPRLPGGGSGGGSGGGGFPALPPPRGGGSDPGSSSGSGAGGGGGANPGSRRDRGQGPGREPPSGAGPEQGAGSGAAFEPPRGSDFDFKAGGEASHGARGDRAHAGPSEGDRPPAWARELQHRQTLAHGTGLALHAVGSGETHGGGAAPSLQEER